MVTLRYTGVQIVDQFPGLTDLSQVFAAFEKKFEEEGQVICQFRINGLQFNEADEMKAKFVSMTEIENVEILVDTPANLLEAVIMNWIEELPGMIEKTDAIAESFRKEGFQIQYTPFVRIVDSCQFLIDSLLSIQSLRGQDKIVGSAEWRKLEASTVKAIGESLGAFEKKDANWLADVLEYDLANSLQNWYELLKKIDGKFTELEQSNSTQAEPAASDSSIQSKDGA